MFKNVGVVGSSSAFVLFIIGQTFFWSPFR